MNANTQVYEKIPHGFSPQVEVAAVYVNVGGKILLLQLADYKQEKGAWGVPAGKLEEREAPLYAARRELLEETGIDAALQDFQTLGALYIRKPGLDYIYHLFNLPLNIVPSLSLSAEHRSHLWVSKEEALSLPLMDGASHALHIYYQKVSQHP